MRNSKTFATIMLLTAAATAWGQAPVELGPPMTMRFAGVTLAIPKDFRLQRPVDPYRVLRAVKYENEEPVFAICLTALSSAGKVSLQGLIKDTEQRIKNHLAIRRFRVVKKMPFPVAGVQGEVHVQTYRYSGIKTTALSLYFARKVTTADIHVGYVLTVEAERKRGREALPILGAVARSIRLFDPIRPIAEPIRLEEQAIEVPRLGYALRPPQQWKLRFSRAMDEVDLFQTDYLSLGLAMPQASVLVKPTTGSAEDVVIESLAKLEDNLKKQVIEYRLLRKGPLKSAMAGRDGYEFFLHRKLPFREGKVMPVVIARRTICARGRAYTLFLMYPAERVEPVRRALDALAAGFKLISPATAPASGRAGVGSR